ncbi:MAG: hypothetical protein ACP5PM_06900 [Acidimicrobiales bacterium]
MRSDAGQEGKSPTADELFEAAEEVIRQAEQMGTRMRLLGGIAVRHLARSAALGPFARSYHDYDVVVSSRDGAVAARVFRSLGYGEDPHFNALHGAQRMIFSSDAGFDVDVLVGTFQMCHRLELGADLPEGGLTVHPADLLLTKLQIVQIEEKDLGDAAAILHDVPIGTGGDRAIELERFVRPLVADWGFYHTVELNLGKVAEHAKRVLDSEMLATVERSVATLRAEMERAPKSMKWKMRARIGEKVTWYELPEEV